MLSLFFYLFVQMVCYYTHTSLMSSIYLSTISRTQTNPQSSHTITRNSASQIQIDATFFSGRARARAPFAQNRRLESKICSRVGSGFAARSATHFRLFFQTWRSSQRSCRITSDSPRLPCSTLSALEPTQVAPAPASPPATTTASASGESKWARKVLARAPRE